MTSSFLGRLIVRGVTVVISRNFMALKDVDNPKKTRLPLLHFVVAS